MTRCLSSVTAIAVALAIVSLPDSARACGGCFAPTGQPSPVTAHRMAIALSNEATTLWDQFEYQGAAEDFVWVLPVSGGQDVVVELSDDNFFQGLQTATQITLQGPATSGGGGSSGLGCGFGSQAAYEDGSAVRDPVVVYQQSVVGPYETVILGSDTADSLVSWLQDRGYGVPDEMLPTIDHYVGQGSNFVVLRLAPGEGVQRMQPVRVTMPGLNTTFPLRMVAAGVFDHVALDLYIFAEGRYEATNFPNGEINRSEVSYNPRTRQFSYDELADEVLLSNEGRTWLTEYAHLVWTEQLSAAPIYDDAGTPHYASDDWDHVAGLLDRPYLTRMRADLTVDALSEDLELTASAEGDISSFINVTNVRTEREATASASSEIRTTLALGPAPYALVVAAVMLVGRRRRRR